MFVGGCSEAGKRHRLTISGTAARCHRHPSSYRYPPDSDDTDRCDTLCFILNANDEIRHRNDTGYKNSIKEIISGLDD